MNSYKIFLTKSSEVARRIAKSFDGAGRTEDIASVSNGYVHEDNKHIPAIYSGKKYSYCIVELKPVNEHDVPTYELMIC